MAGASQPAVLKRLAALNRSGVLSKPLQYSQVKADLVKLDEERALRLLNQLEVDAAGVAEPLSYLRDGVAAALAESASAAAVPRKRPLDAAVGGSSADGAVAKRIRLLNDSGRLVRPLVHAEVADALASVGTPQAMIILKSLEGFADTVRDPAAYVRTAVRSAGGVAPVPLGVKQELGAVKAEPKGRDFRGVKAEELSESDKLERHIGWLNRNKNLQQPLEPVEVLPALDSIGYRQAMRVLRRFEDTCDEVADPNEFIKDLVARSGWIWARPDAVDEDEKVAKRVAWMNQFGMLRRPIDYAQVADMLDGLKVPHAMVLLRELEVQSHKIEDPTEFIKTSIGSAGVDEVQMPPAAEDSSLGQLVASLNRSCKFPKPINFQEIGQDLSRLGHEEAVRLLQEVSAKSRSLRDPTGFIKFKLKAKLASGGAAGPDIVSTETKLLKRIEWLNDYGGLKQDIDYSKVSTALESVGLVQAMQILNDLEAAGGGAKDPNAFILTSCKACWRRGATDQTAGGATASTSRPAASRPASEGSLQQLAHIASLLNSDPRVRKKASISELAAALRDVGPQRAAQLLQQMQSTGAGLEDPLKFIRSAGRPASLVKQEPGQEEGRGEETDDVTRITRRLRWLNKFAGLQQEIEIDEVVGALYCLGVTPTMDILRRLQERAPDVADPTRFIKVEVQRANGLEVPEEPAAEAAAAEEPEDEDVTAAELDAYFGAEAGEVDDDMPEEVVVDFDEPEGEEEAAPGAAGLVEYDLGEEDGECGPGAGQAGGQRGGPRRVVGALSGAVGKLVPEHREGAATLPMTPQEKLVRARDLAVKHGLKLEYACLKELARLPLHKVKDLIDDVLLGGRWRTTVTNPSRYLTIQCQKVQSGLGVEQGIAMELAVSLGVVLNNDALDELASIPRKEAHAIIRDVATSEEARLDPLDYIRAEVLKVRAQLDARPWPPTG